MQPIELIRLGILELDEDEQLHNGGDAGTVMHLLSASGTTIRGPWGDSHDSKTEQATDDVLHSPAEGGIPQQGDGVEGQEEIKHNIGDHAEIAHAGADCARSIVGGASRLSADVRREDGGNEGPD